VVLTMSKKSCEEYRKRGAHADYLPAGVDTDIFCPHQSQAPLRVLCATRVHYYKGVSAYLDAIPLVLEKRPDILFSLHGPIDSNTNYAGEIFSLIESTLKMYGRNFTYEGDWLPPERLPQVFKGANIFVFPSDNEGFGVPLIEAMSCGMPCIVLDKFPMNEIVRQSLTGECLPVRQESMDRYHGYRFPHPEDIAAAILRYAQQPETLYCAGELARKRVEQEYSLDGCVRKLLSCVALVTGKKVSLCAC
jgi:glycosyltransferase involved in cell wall biosynthesis